MKKDTLRGIVVVGVLLVLYILIAFLIPFAHTMTFWFSFVFTLAAFAVTTAAVYMALGKDSDAKSKFYGFPIARIGVIYGAMQLIVSLLFMALAAILPAWIAVLVYALGLGAALIGLISAETVVEQIKEQDIKLKGDTTLMRTLQSKVNQLSSQSGDAAIKALAEEFRYSDPVSSDALAEIERDLAAVVDELQAAVIDADQEAAGQLCRKAAAVLAERNRQCKLNKN